MKDIIKDLIKKSLDKIDKDNGISIENIEVGLCKDKRFGDFSSNIAMKFSTRFESNPKKFAENIPTKRKLNENG